MLKLVQVLKALSERFSPKSADYGPIDSAIVESGKDCIVGLRERYNGRYPNEVRAFFHSAFTLVASHKHGTSYAEIGKRLNINPRHLSDGHARWSEYYMTGGLSSSLVVWRGKERSDKAPEVWNIWVREVAWLHDTITRVSESTYDSMRNPHNHRDKQRYRYHWLETKRWSALTLWAGTIFRTITCTKTA